MKLHLAVSDQIRSTYDNSDGIVSVMPKDAKAGYSPDCRAGAHGLCAAANCACPCRHARQRHPATKPPVATTPALRAVADPPEDAETAHLNFFYDEIGGSF